MRTGYLLEEQSCQISSRSDLKRRSLGAFLKRVAPTRTKKNKNKKNLQKEFLIHKLRPW